MREEQYRNKSLYLSTMKPVLVYFISGDFDEWHVLLMEEKLKQIHPDRDTDVFYVDSEEEKYKLLSIYNLEEIDPYVGDLLWEAIDEEDDGTGGV